MINTIVAYVNFHFPKNKTQFYCDNFIKACLVYQYLYAKYFTQNININQIIYQLSDARHSCKSKSTVIANHLIFILAFRSFWKRYRLGRGCVYAINTPFRKYQLLGLLTGVVYWCFHRGVVEGRYAVE